MEGNEAKDSPRTNDINYNPHDYPHDYCSVIMMAVRKAVSAATLKINR